MAFRLPNARAILQHTTSQPSLRAIFHINIPELGQYRRHHTILAYQACHSYQIQTRAYTTSGATHRAYGTPPSSSLIQKPLKLSGLLHPSRSASYKRLLSTNSQNHGHVSEVSHNATRPPHPKHVDSATTADISTPNPLLEHAHDRKPRVGVYNTQFPRRRGLISRLLSPLKSVRSKIPSNRSEQPQASPSNPQLSDVTTVNNASHTGDVPVPQLSTVFSQPSRDIMARLRAIESVKRSTPKKTQQQKVVSKQPSSSSSSQSSTARKTSQQSIHPARETNPIVSHQTDHTTPPPQRQRSFLQRIGSLPIFPLRTPMLSVPLTLAIIMAIVAWNSQGEHDDNDNSHRMNNHDDNPYDYTVEALNRESFTFYNQLDNPDLNQLETQPISNQITRYVESIRYNAPIIKECAKQYDSIGKSTLQQYYTLLLLHLSRMPPRQLVVSSPIVRQFIQQLREDYQLAHQYRQIVPSIVTSTNTALDILDSFHDLLQENDQGLLTDEEADEICENLYTLHRKFIHDIEELETGMKSCQLLRTTTEQALDEINKYNAENKKKTYYTHDEYYFHHFRSILTKEDLEDYYLQRFIIGPSARIILGYLNAKAAQSAEIS